MADRASVSHITDDTAHDDAKCDRKPGHPGLCMKRCTATPGCTERVGHRGRCTEGTFNMIAWQSDSGVAVGCTAATAGAPVSPVQATDHADSRVPPVTDDMVEAAAKELRSDYDAEFDAEHLSWQDFTGAARKVLSAALAGCTVVPEPPERGEVAARMARGRQWIAHTNSNRMGMPVPAWDALTPAEQEQAETEARYWIQAAVNTGVKIVPPGWTVVALPEPDGVDGDVTVWSYTGTDEVHAYVEDGRAFVGYLYNNDDPEQAEELGLALVAAAREARRLAGSVSPKGDNTE